MTSVAGPQRVLVVGSGGREHALAWTLAREPGVEAVIAAPGNAGMVDVASVHGDVAATDHQGLLRLALESGSDLVVIGPEEPLTEGLADLMARSGMTVFGPSAEAARLEGSKSFCRQLADAAGVPMADGAGFDQPAEAIDFVHAIGPPVVVKADGLAAGKGVSICGTATEARAAIHDAMVAGVFGPAGARVVIERALVGHELSLVCLTDGRGIARLPAARDHKRLGDGDSGPNTGGMGAFSPVEGVTDQDADALVRSFHEPLLAELARRGVSYRGALYAGLMLTGEGPYLLECNVRLGDPETQVMLPRLAGRLGPLLLATATGSLASGTVATTGAAVGVVLTAAGYPVAARRGDAIAEEDTPGTVFWSGVRRSSTGGLETAGGRVATAVGTGADVTEAAQVAYRTAERIAFAGRHFRRDIGRSAVLSAAPA